MSNKERGLYKVLNPIGYGGRRERGEVIDMEEDAAKAYGPEYVVAYDGEQSPEVATTEDKALEEMSIAELKAKAKALDLSVTGSKADLIERIELAQA